MHVQYAVKLRITSHSQLTLSANTRRTIPVLQRQTNSFKYTHNKKQIREPCIIYINDIQLQFVSDFLQSCFMAIAICFTRYHHEFTSTWPQCLNTWALAEKKIYIFINKPFRPLKSSDIKKCRHLFLSCNGSFDYSRTEYLSWRKPRCFMRFQSQSCVVWFSISKKVIYDVWCINQTLLQLV